MPKPGSKMPEGRLDLPDEQQAWDGTLPTEIDLARMRGERHERLQRAMADEGVGAMLLFGAGAVQYGAGPRLVGADAGRAVHQRTAVLVIAGDPSPHVLSAPSTAPRPDLDADHVHPGLYLESAEGVLSMAATVSKLAGRLPERLAVDDLTGPCFSLREQCFPGVDLVEAGSWSR